MQKITAISELNRLAIPNQHGPHGKKARQIALQKVRTNRCTCSSTHALTAESLKGRQNLGTTVFDYDFLRVTTDSLLYQVMKGLPCPIPRHAKAFANFLRWISPKAREQQILTTRLTAVSPHDLRELYSLIEDEIEKSPIVNKISKSRHVRMIFSLTQVCLLDGTRLDKVQFRTRFSQGRQASTKLIPGLTDLDTPAESNFNSFTERNSKSLEHVTNVRKGILDVCIARLDIHETCIAHLRNARELGVPPLLSSTLAALELPPTNNGKIRAERTIRRLPADELLRVWIHYIDKHDLYLSIPNGIPYVELDTLHPYSDETSPPFVLEASLSEYYLPISVSMACLVILLVDTAWNLETMLDVKLNQIKRTPTGYQLIGVKGRVSKLHTTSISMKDEALQEDIKIEEPVAVRAIELLIDNALFISKITGNQNESLFICRHRKKVHEAQFEIPLTHLEIKRLFEYFDAPAYVTRDFRRVAAHYNYMSPGGSIFTTQALLEHESPETTLEYLNSHVFQNLLEANTLRFMRKLEATTLYVTGRNKKLKERQLSEHDIQGTLFPAYAKSAENCFADNWLLSPDLNIEIGIEEIKYCVIQYRFYVENYQSLISENPKKFVLLYAPRLMFCIALKRIINASVHRTTYNRIESAYK